MAEQHVETPTRARSGTAERVTVNLTTRACQALEEVVSLTGETKTDAINRALLVYAMLHRTQADGGTIYTRESGANDLERLRIL